MAVPCFPICLTLVLSLLQALQTWSEHQPRASGSEQRERNVTQANMLRMATCSGTFDKSLRCCFGWELPNLEHAVYVQRGDCDNSCNARYIHIEFANVKFVRIDAKISVNARRQYYATSSILFFNYAFKKFYRRILSRYSFSLNIADMISLSLNMHECPRWRLNEFERMNIQ